MGVFWAWMYSQPPALLWISPLNIAKTPACIVLHYSPYNRYHTLEVIFQKRDGWIKIVVALSFCFLSLFSFTRLALFLSFFFCFAPRPAFSLLSRRFFPSRSFRVLHYSGKLNKPLHCLKRLGPGLKQASLRGPGERGRRARWERAHLAGL